MTTRRTSPSTLFCTLAAVLLLAAPVAAQEIDPEDPEDPVQARPVPWLQAFELAGSGGLVNPGVLVGFNPQPEPPARIAELSFAANPMPDLYPPDPILTLRDQSQTEGDPQLFDVFLALGVPMVDLSFSAPVIAAGVPGVRTEARTSSGDLMFQILLDLSSSSGGIVDPASLVGFNPQPEPPAGYGSGVFGMSFAMTSLSDVMLRLQVFDADGNPIALRAVPEPPALAALGLALLALQRWRRRPSAGQPG
jgi:hypothetical protein